MSYFDAYRVARKAPMQAWVETSFAPVVRQDPLTEDEASDEELYVNELRHQAKDVSRGIAASGCLPADARQPAPRKSASVNMMMLSDVAVLLQDITTRSRERETQSKTSKIWQKLHSENLLPGADAKGESCTKPDNERRAIPKHEAPSFEKQSSPSKRSTVRRHSEAVKAAKTAEFFCMDTEEDYSIGKAATRDSSLFRSYDALGVAHYTLDDDAGPEQPSAALGRESSIHRCYDALGKSAGGLSERVASRAGDLQPVRPPSRQTRQTQRSLCAGASAMDLDMGYCNSDTGVDHVVRTSTPVVQTRQSRSMGGCARVSKSDAKDTKYLTLPRLHGVHKLSDLSTAKSGLTMKTDSGGVPFSDVSSRRPARWLNTSQRVVF